MLRGIKEAGFGITAFFLPASDGGPGRFVELAVDLGAKPSPVSRRCTFRRILLVRPIWSSVSRVASSKTADESRDANSRGVLLGPALVALVLPKIPRIVAVRIKARMIYRSRPL